MNSRPPKGAVEFSRLLRTQAPLVVMLVLATTRSVWCQDRPVLEYHPLTDGGCPSEGQVRAAVSRDFGFAFFEDGSEGAAVRGLPRSVRIDVHRVGGRLHGAVVLVTPDGREEVLRVRSARGANACRAVVNRLLTRFSVVLHARGLDPPTSPAAPAAPVEAPPPVVAPSPMVAVAPPLVLQPSRAATEPVAVEVSAERERDQRWTLWGQGTVGFAYETLPGVAPTLSAAIHLERSAWSVGVEGRGDLPVAAAEIEAFRWGVGLSACRAFGILGLCALGRGGAVEARAPALRAAQSGSASFLEFGVRAQLVFPLGSRFAVTLAAEGVGQVLGARFVAATAMGNDVIWEVPWASLGVTAGFRVRIW